ncbi:tobamovirus multiplication protein 2A-like [Vicia villosa]|uniref:tobamovirus multiplication protein 2A-like n=1 Tax=Vicia villosa TaxID=3911 RepID=UPI00273CBD80|nr:tobamovirus multiplication protein 2A-like [Vicia villosa]
MAKRPFFEFILQVINLVLSVLGLGTLGFGLVCFFKSKQNIPNDFHNTLIIYVTIGVGAILLIISCLGSIGIAKRSPCCLITYCVFLVPLIIAELGISLFIFFDHSWKKVILDGINKDYFTVYKFVNHRWNVIKWIALGVFILQVIALILAIYLRSVFNRARYDLTDAERERGLYRQHPRKYTYDRLGTPTPTRIITIPRSSGVSVRVNGSVSAKPSSSPNTNANV